ncbi:hypothetical protein EVAR_77522_1 [Eumeta japonica]|uniref:Uncharacterized protein n=1 Tax=Eumeta variegata TaxID=151549 RepID=A0A4C1T9K0_EUMVA|nr:hypothetical protein EVAR_77522_1 [Eumeta japonica]
MTPRGPLPPPAQRPLSPLYACISLLTFTVDRSPNERYLDRAVLSQPLTFYLNGVEMKIFEKTFLMSAESNPNRSRVFPFDLRLPMKSCDRLKSRRASRVMIEQSK